MVDFEARAPAGGLTADKLTQVLDVLDDMEAILDETQSDDRFGTEGWHHNFGWNE
jgi:hypothetical protein